MQFTYIHTERGLKNPSLLHHLHRFGADPRDIRRDDDTPRARFGCRIVGHRHDGRSLFPDHRHPTPACLVRGDRPLERSPADRHGNLLRRRILSCKGQRGGFHRQCITAAGLNDRYPFRFEVGRGRYEGHGSATGLHPRIVGHRNGNPARSLFDGNPGPRLVAHGAVPIHIGGHGNGLHRRTHGLELKVRRFELQESPFQLLLPARDGKHAKHCKEQQFPYSFHNIEVLVIMYLSQDSTRAQKMQQHII